MNQDHIGPLIYIDILKNSIKYYDSYGERPPKIIYKFMTKLADKLENRNKNDSILIYNDKRHQYGGSECGIYSIYFILQCINGRFYV